MNNFRPLSNQVMLNITPEEIKQLSKTGLIFPVPDDKSPEPRIGIISKIGPLADPKLGLVEGKKVYYRNYHGIELFDKETSKKYFILSANDLLLIEE